MLLPEHDQREHALMSVLAKACPGRKTFAAERGFSELEARRPVRSEDDEAREVWRRAAASMSDFLSKQRRDEKRVEDKVVQAKGR